MHIAGVPVAFYKREDIVPVSRMYIPGYTALSGSQHPVYFTQMINELKGVQQTVKPWRKIFISRAKSPFRNLEPWPDVKAMLLETGFEVIETDSMSLTEQINLFGECSHLAAVHGAGLTNMAFMNTGAKVFEIRREDDILNYCYYKMAHILGIPYYYFLTSSMNRSKKIQNDNFTVDVTELQKELQKFIA
jgi:capsular polysaccharide biosynthesis protein